MNHPERILEFIENRTFDEIRIGDSACLTRTLREEDIQLFAIMSGDVNPTHVDPEYAERNGLKQVVGHGMWGGALISSILGTEFPGPGTVYVDQTLHFSRCVSLGDTLHVTVTCKEKVEASRHIIFDCRCVNQKDELVIQGTARVLAPTEKVKRPRVQLPEIVISDKDARYHHMLDKAKGLPPIPIAVAHPCDTESLKGPLTARDEGLAIPVLVGPEDKIRSVAEQHGLDLHGCRIINVPHSHAAAAHAVAMARSGEVQALMKGSLHTDELMSEVVAKATGLRTGRRLSHVFLMDVPTYPRPLLITDAAINIEPTLEEKADIVQNAIELAQVLGVAEPKVALLAAVETINVKMRSTIDAAALCKMADRGQIKGGLLDGPLAFDNAISMLAARTKGIQSKVAGQADILLVPDIESGNMLAKQLEYLANAMAAGIVLGAKVPIVLTSRADSAETRAASCAIAQLMTHYRQKRK